MVKTFRILIYLFCWSSISAGAVEQVGAAVEELLVLAKGQNPELATMRYEAEAAAQRAEASGAFPDPSFRISLQDFTNKESGASTTLVPSQVGSTYYRVMQPLPFWGKRGLKQEIAEAETSQARGRSSTTWSELATKIKIDFAQYYFVSNSLKLTQEMLDLTLNLERIAKSRYSTGLAPQQDVIRAQVEQTGLRRDLLMLQTERHHNMTRLNASLQRAPDAIFAEPKFLRKLPPPAKVGFATLVEQLRKQSPQLFTIQAQINAAEKSRELTYKNRLPDFSLGVGATQTGNDIKMWELMLEFNLPLQQGARRGQEREAESMRAAAQSRKDSAISMLQAELYEYTVALETARHLEVINSSSLLPQAEATLQAAYVGYQNGKVDFATLLDAQRQILKAKLDVLSAQVQAQTSLAQIEKLLGEDL